LTNLNLIKSKMVIQSWMLFQFLNALVLLVTVTYSLHWLERRQLYSNWKTLINSPNIDIAHFTIAIFFIDRPDLNLFLDSSNVTQNQTFDSICKKYNLTLEQIMPPLVKHWKSRTHLGSMWNLIWHLLTTFLIFTIIAWIIELYIQNWWFQNWNT
jgi:hypothetical protein